MEVPSFGLQEPSSEGSAGGIRAAERSGLIKRSGQPADPAELYDNAVKHRDELPGAQPPRHFAHAKNGLLALSALSVLAGLATLAFGAYVEGRRGFKTEGMWDVPTDISTGSIFLGCFTLSVSVTLMVITYRNWHPVLLTYMLFALMIVISNLTIFGMMLPGAGLNLLRANAWSHMPPELHQQFFQKFNCCGYDRALVRNRPTCNLAAIGKGPGTLVTAPPSSLPPLSVPPPPSAAPAPSSAPQSSSAPSPSSAPAPSSAPSAATASLSTSTQSSPVGDTREELSQSQELNSAVGGRVTRSRRTSTSSRLFRRQAQTPPAATTAPAPGGEPPIPQFTNPLPLSTDSKPTGPPSVPSFGPPVPDSGVDFCQKAVEPSLNAEMSSIRPWFVFAALLGMGQLGVLYAYAKMLSAWKMSRGFARW